MILYLDTSALVKRYVVESESKDVNGLIQQADSVGSALLTRVEMASALAKAVRLNWVEENNAEMAWLDFLSEWLSFTRLSVTPGLVERAARLAWDYGLRGYDATHFAAALMWQEVLETPVTLATYDRELWLAAKKANMDVWPVGLSS
jgi:predicted nucleic acid-binding protein